MELITNNPFRVAGVLSNASARELARQKAKISAYANIGREVNSEFDFESLGDISRSDVELVESAFSSIEQNHNKVNHALFWFLNVNAFDSTAIEYLKANNTEKATEIWEKVTEGRDINSKNFSSFNNLGTIKLLSEDRDDIKVGIEAKVKLIESDLFKDFVHAVADETYVIANDKQIELFINALLVHFNNEYSREETIELFDNCNGSAQSYLVKKLTDEPIYKIEKQIENTKTKRKENQSDLYRIGLNLYLYCKDDLSFLKSQLGLNDLRYKMLSDNLANEITQCGIDYFNEWKDTKDPSSESLKLLKYADLITVSSQIKDRIKDNKEGIEEWATMQVVDSDISAVIDLLNTNFKQTLYDVEMISSAEKLVEKAIPYLLNIKSVLKGSHPTYMSLSTSVAAKAQGYIIETINKAQEPRLYGGFDFDALVSKLNDAWEVIQFVESLDMDFEFLQNFNDNKYILRGLCTKYHIKTSLSSHPKIPVLNFIITDSEITNTDKHNSPLLVTDPLYDKFIRYIGLKLKIKTFEPQTINLFLKYVDSKGNVNRNTKNSPVGYTLTSNKQVNSNMTSISIGGWGNNEKCTYEVGKHSIEVWVEGFMIHKKEFRVELSPSQKIEAEIKQAEIKLKEIKDTTYFSSEIRTAQNELVIISGFKFLRFGGEKRRQIEAQNKKINELKRRSNNKKTEEIAKQNAVIARLNEKLSKAKY